VFDYGNLAAALGELGNELDQERRFADLGSSYDRYDWRECSSILNVFHDPSGAMCLWGCL
jgi:hypothetical protein